MIHDAKRPQVIVSLKPDEDKNMTSLVVQNYGSGVARNVTFSGFDESIFMPEFRPQVMKTFVRSGIPVLVPGARRSTVIAAGHMDDELVNAASNITVTFDELGLLRRNKHVSESFIIEYRSFSGSTHTESETKLIRKALEKIVLVETCKKC